MTDADVHVHTDEEGDGMAPGSAPGSPPGILAWPGQEPEEFGTGDDDGDHGGDGDGDGGVTWVKAADRAQPSSKPRDAWIIRLGQRLCGGGRSG